MQTTQIKVTLPEELYLHLKSKADKFGLGLSSYIRHLVINDVKDIDIPTFKMSKQREKIGLKAQEDYKAGKTTLIENVDKYLDSL
ncbi:hypothetical protein A2382_02680 [Candidatus Woesebacteria bacterium RIFOXYB1_FULL_38_16]|uniref:Ribbon-helix-helix protein CopG domain-containing protein n=1 Tax=Candidatus Woesebacteria bacterium RIFOXYB1_FULL_38_16 TaxID=1802538 RepID=A0A1F8CS06_9BACT|nr:MAG: hypothetical protein A2191_03860 [Candidatus Woesebacteria bacterium RIFOXYA1_FULL_38_9]OGM79117.1 MAG: hypothetical protein A2382_02680 [Candidatus Woesebacteria bacterium RIFOXYB1_FULL_38_16]